MNDLKVTWRQAMSKPLFAFLIVGVLTLGIGATAAIFSMTDAVLFRSLAVSEPERVVRVFIVDESGTPTMNMNFPAFTDLRDNARSFSHVAAYQAPNALNLAEPGHEPARVSGAVVSGDYFALFGVAPVLGRYLLPSDDLVRAGHPVAVIGERLWHTRFNADPGVIGREIQLNTHSFTIVGVMPARFDGASNAGQTEVWVPMTMLEQATPFQRWSLITDRNSTWHDVVARLEPGVTLQAAQAEVDAIVAGVVEETGRPIERMRLGLSPASDAAVDPFGRQGTHRNALLLLAVTATLLLIAMTNAASLLLVRTEERARELALRLGVGASRTRVMRMLLVEALVYALVGATLGLLLGWLVVSAALPSLRAALGIGPADAGLLAHPRVLALAILLAVLTAMSAVVSPALRVLRIDLNTTLKQGAARDPKGGARTRNMMVVGQVALSVALLAVALLLIRSFWHTAAIDTGFDTRNTMLASVDMLRQGYTPEQALQAQQTLLERLDAHPAVVSAAFATTVPVSPFGSFSSYDRPGGGEETRGFTVVSPVSAGFFETMRIPLLQGRAFGHADAADSPNVVVVSRAFADQAFPGEEAIGKPLNVFGAERTVVGIAADVKVRNLRETAEPVVWMPLAQRPAAQADVIIRGHGDPWALLSVLRSELRQIDPNVPLFRTRTLADHVGTTYQEATVMAWLLGAFAALAVVLSVAGLYGLLSWHVRTRTREIGVRLAIGASASAIRGQFLRRGLLLAAIGIPVGLVAAVWVGRLLEGLLFGVTAHDPVTMGAVVFGFMALVLVATWMPAQRSSRISPTQALRDE